MRLNNTKNTENLHRIMAGKQGNNVSFETMEESSEREHHVREKQQYECMGRKSADKREREETCGSGSNACVSEREQAHRQQQLTLAREEIAATAQHAWEQQQAKH